jgi:hypothetical protein
MKMKQILFKVFKVCGIFISMFNLLFIGAKSYSVTFLVSEIKLSLQNIF